MRPRVFELEQLLEPVLTPVRVRHSRPGRHAPVAVALHHRQRARHQVAQVVGQVGVVARHERAVGVVPVLAERALAQEEVTHRVGAVLLQQRHRVDHVARGLAQLLAVLGQVPVGVDARRHRHAGRLEHGRPVQAVEADDLLAHQVQPLVGPLPVGLVGLAARPLRAEAQRGDVVGQRVHPHVEDVVGLLGDRDAPLDPRAADAEVLQAVADHRQHLVAARHGVDADALAVVLAGLDLLAQPGAEVAQPEEVVLLLGPLARALVVGADVARLAQLVFGLEALAARAVPAGVGALVDRRAPERGQRALQAPPQLEHAALVALFGGADEVVVGEPVAPPQLAEVGRQAVAVLLLADAPLARDALDVLAVLVGAGQPEDVVPHELARARQGVGRHRGVGVAHVRDVVQVVDRRGVVQRLARAHVSCRRQAHRAAAWTSLIGTPCAAAARRQWSNSGWAL